MEQKNMTLYGKNACWSSVHPLMLMEAAIPYTATMPYI